jgi:hypothetical protein
MERDTTFGEIRRILEQYDGVAVESIQPMRSAIRIVTRITEPASLARLARASEGANLNTSFWWAGKDEEFGDPTKLRYEFRIPEPDDDTPSRLEIFGIYLVWDLSRSGKMRREEANRLLSAWHGKSV